MTVARRPLATVVAYVVLAFMAAAMPGCVAVPPQASSLPVGDTMAKLAADYWQASLSFQPMAATVMGARGDFDAELDDLSPQARSAFRAKLGVFLQRAALMQNPSDRLNRDLLIEQIESELRVDAACHYAEWRIDHLAGVQAQLADLAANHKTQSPEQLTALISRYAAVPRFIGQHIDNLNRGLFKGWVASEINVTRTIAQIDGMTQATFAVSKDAELVAAVDKWVLPSLARYRNFLQKVVLPEARRTPGVGALSIGAECYLAEIRSHTGLSMDPAAIHRLGQDEVARIRREMDVIMLRAAKTRDMRVASKTLGVTYASRDALLKDARAIVARAQAALPRAFSKLPKTALVVEPLEAYREMQSPAAFYSPAPIDHSKPGRYLLNTFEPGKRVAYNSEALAFHEGVPGHHLQIAIAQELTNVPDFRRYGGHSAYVEGWALYAETLANELGLYSGDAAQFGRLSFECWRAMRLVVDTGLHVYGWSREQAIDAMLQFTASPRIEVENEVDRYVTWPGQALAYKIGELELKRLRREAEKQPGFDLRRFHARVLEEGPMPLGILAKRLQRVDESGKGATR